MDALTRYFYLVGYPLGHTISPAMYNSFFKSKGLDAVYRAVEIEPGGLEGFIKELRVREEFVGLNVTMPYKTEIKGLLDSLSRASATIGAVNCVVRRGGILIGHNTDWKGFIEALNRASGKRSFRKAVIVGAGGASRAALYALRGLVEEVVIFSRSGSSARRLSREASAWHEWTLRGYKADRERIMRESRDADLAVNASPVGLDSWETPIPGEVLGPGMVVFDMVYKPLETRLLKEAREAGATVVDGLWMLAFQAAENIKLWLGARASPDSLRSSVVKFLGGEQG